LLELQDASQMLLGSFQKLPEASLSSRNFCEAPGSCREAFWSSRKLREVSGSFRKLQKASGKLHL
jgi:hypothetical protein